jgi:WhiB family transcriptional regulator, redox-sensing transcriptional regulator
VRVPRAGFGSATWGTRRKIERFGCVVPVVGIEPVREDRMDHQGGETTMAKVRDEVSSWGWQEKAACRGMSVDLFFAPDGERQRERERREGVALQVCAQCPVRRNCLEHALRGPENYGVWGGTTEEGRTAERRRRRRLSAA